MPKAIATCHIGDTRRPEKAEKGVTVRQPLLGVGAFGTPFNLYLPGGRVMSTRPHTGHLRLRKVTHVTRGGGDAGARGLLPSDGLRGQVGSRAGVLLEPPDKQEQAAQEGIQGS